MADNYLEKRQQELASSQKKVVVRNHPSLEPVALIAIGKPAESVFLLPSEGENLNYYRKEGVHYVPKLTTDHLII